jgi:hypothetical protein
VQPYFSSYPLFDNSWEDYFSVLIAVILALLIVQLHVEKKDRAVTNYDSRLAWYRAGAYFCTCFLASWETGVFKTLTRSAWITAENIASSSWLGFTTMCLIVVIFGYGYIWRKGTLSHGRPLHLLTVIGFGFLWGISEGQLFLSFWALSEKFSLPLVWTVVAAFALASIFKGIWHSTYWDIHVSPEHNIEEWNNKKVFFAHIPNLVCCLAYLAVTGSAGMFVLFQTLALMLSTYFMRFPGFNAQVYQIQISSE